MLNIKSGLVESITPVCSAYPCQYATLVMGMDEHGLATHPTESCRYGVDNATTYGIVATTLFHCVRSGNLDSTHLRSGVVPR